MNRPDPRSFFPTHKFGEIQDITPITMGMSGAAVYSVTTEKGSFILRIHGADRKLWERSLILQALAADHGVAPPLVLIDKKAAATVMVKVQGMPFGYAVAQPTLRHAVLTSLVEQLRALHAIPTAGLPVNDPMKMSWNVWNDQVKRPGFPAWAVPLRSRLEAAEAVLAQDRRQVLSHCDPNPANLMWDNQRVWLVDWEQAGLAHPYLDLSIVSNFLALPDATALELLAAQEDATPDAEQQKVFLAIRGLTRVIFGTIFLSLVPDLETVTFASPDATPTLLQCYQMMATGQLQMSQPQGQAQFAAALLAQGLN